MKVIIRESRLMDLAVKFINDRFPDLVEEADNHSISYIDPSTNTTVFSLHDDGLVVFYNDVFTTFNGMFGMSENEIKQWVIDYYGLDVNRVILFLK